jgi:BCD family chlorophyll transporter-like MFS transporter
MATARDGGRGSGRRVSDVWRVLGTRFLPFADAATEELPLGRLLRLGLFQVSVAIVVTLLTGTLNRVMIVELRVPATLVALVLGIPLLVAPFRTLVGFRSDTYVSALGWRRVPFIWFGSLLQFGGLAIMPFALILLSGDTRGPVWLGHAATALAFLLVGAGLHTAQTAGLALATDLAPAHARSRVVALLYLLLLVGTIASAFVLGRVLADFTQVRLIQVIQGAAMATMALNVVALWKQEPRRPRSPAERAAATSARPRFREAWARFAAAPQAARLLVATAIGTVALNMQDVLLEPYGGEILRLGVGATTSLTALMATGAAAALALAAHRLARGGDAIRLAAWGALVGVVGLTAVVFSAPLGALPLFRAGTALMGFGDGLFGVCTLVAAMTLRDPAQTGLALGAWSAVQACGEGFALAASGAMRDLVSHVTATGVMGDAMRDPSVAYSAVFHLEIGLLFATVVALGPLASPRRAPGDAPAAFGLADLPT